MLMEKTVYLLQFLVVKQLLPLLEKTENLYYSIIFLKFRMQKELEKKGFIATAQCHEIRLDLPEREMKRFRDADKRAQHRIDLCGALLFLIPGCACAVWLSLDFVADSWRDNEWSNDPGGLPRWPIKPAIPLAFLLLLLQGIAEAIKRWAALRGVATTDELGLRLGAQEDGDER